MNTFMLEILSPERVFYSGECVSLILPVGDGMMGIMANHTPLTAAIPDGEITLTKPDGEKLICAVMRGMADVTGNRVRILCEAALSPDEIDEEQERRDAETARIEMQRHESEKEYKLWQLSFNKAVNRLKVKQKDSHINL